MGKYALIIHYPTGGMRIGKVGSDRRELEEVGYRYIQEMSKSWGWSKDELREYIVEDDTNIRRVYDVTLGKDIAEWDRFYRRGWIDYCGEGHVDLAVLEVE
jgi:hypothetical protein